MQLWSISKDDGSVVSLGLIERQKHIEKFLSKPQWGIIKESEFLIVSVENKGGSISGHPSEKIISKGLCVQVEGWKKKTT